MYDCCRPHYNVNLKAIEVGGSFLTLPTDLFETGEKKGTIIDSGTTLAYLPETAYKLLMSSVWNLLPQIVDCFKLILISLSHFLMSSQIFSYQPDLNFHTVQDFLCFRFYKKYVFIIWFLCHKFIVSFSF